MPEFPTRTVGPRPDAPPGPTSTPAGTTPSSAAGPKAAEAAQPASVIGRILSGRYRIDERIAEGGMGTVYRGEHVHLRKRVAIKLLNDNATMHTDIVARFEREAVAGAHVVHQNVAGASDFGQIHDGTYFLVLEYVDGIMLRDVIARGPIAPHRAIAFARQVAAALEAIHEKGIVHRDVKPRNILVDERTERVTLIDFGLAKVPPELLKTKSIMGGTTVVPKQLTVAGTVMGTVAYMAPEAAGGMDNVDARADLYALGLVLYEMLLGKHPFDDTDPGALFLKQKTVKPPSFAERAPDVAVPAAVEALVMRLLEKKPEDRYASAAETIAALDAVAPTLDAAPAAPGFFFAKRRAGTEAAKQGARLWESTVAHASRVVERVRRAELGTRARALGERVLERVPAMRTVPRSVYVGAGVVAITIVVLLAVAVRAKSHSGDDAPATSASAGGSGEPAPTATASEREVVLEVDGADLQTWHTRLRNSMDSRDWKAGARALLAIAKIDPNDLKTGTVREPALAVITGIGVEQTPLADEVYDLLTNGLGTEGLDLLFDIYRSRGGTKAGKRAEEILRRSDVMDRATPALRLNFEFKNAPCDGKSALYDRAVREGDSRTLAQMEILHDADCDRHSSKCCFRQDKALADAIKELRERLGIPPPTRR